MNTNEQTIYAADQASDNQITQRVENAIDEYAQPKKKGNVALRAAAVAGGAVLGVGTAVAATQLLGGDEEAAPEAAAGLSTAQGVTDDMTFDEAFNAARAQVGPGGLFHWHGGVYNTYTEDEWARLSPEEREAFTVQARSAASGSELQADTYAHNAQPASDPNVHQATYHRQATHHTAPEGEQGAHIEGEQNMTLSDGREVIIGQGSFDGKAAVFIDVDRDGHYDMAIVDSNGNGDLDESDETINLEERGISISVHDQSLIPGTDPEPTPADYEIGETFEMELAGQTVTAAKGTLGGHDALYIDADRDGVFDGALVDANDDGHFSEDEIFDVSDYNLKVPGAHVVPAVNDDPVITYDEESLVEIDGKTVIAANGSFDGHRAMFIDIDKDGVYDRAFIDANDNGDLDEGESFDLRGAGITVHDRSLVDPAGDLATDDPSATDAGLDTDSMPDYVNDADGSNHNTMSVADDSSAPDHTVDTGEDAYGMPEEDPGALTDEHTLMAAHSADDPAYTDPSADPTLGAMADDTASDPSFMA